MASRNGLWIAYQLIDRQLGQTAWFICHSEISPESEIKRILPVSGSPYNEESGSHQNDENTAREGILVINRGDWGFYDSRARDEVLDIDYLGNEPNYCINNAAAGLVDWSHANEYVQKWKCITSTERQREPTASGVWMELGTEYMFGRFSFDHTRTVAQSFLFFSVDTCFHRTKIDGMSDTLLFDGTTEERFLKRLEDGWDFSGIDKLLKFNTRGPSGFYPMARRLEPPPRESRLGPFDIEEYVITLEDIDAICIRMKPVVMDAADPGSSIVVSGVLVSKQPQFAEPCKPQIHELLNELVLTFLQICVLPFRQHRTMAEAELTMFNDAPLEQTEDSYKLLGSHLLPAFLGQLEEEVEGIDMRACSARINSFLSNHAGDIPVALDENCKLGLARVVTNLVLNWLNQATRIAPCVGYIVPVSIRCGIYFGDRDLQVARYSAFFWEGRI